MATGRLGRVGRFKEKFFSRKQLLDGNDKSFLALLQLIILGMSGLVLLAQLVSFAQVRSLASQRPTFAQLTNGETLYISERERDFRYPAVVRKAVSDWLLLSFNWEGTIAGTQDPDKGVPVAGSSRKVPFSMSVASVMLEPKFADASLKLFADEIVPQEVFNGSVRQVVVPHLISEPRQTAEGRWEVDVVSTRRLIDKRTGYTEQIAFNKTFKLKAVEIPQSPLGKNATLAEQLIYTALSSGLQITQILPFDPNNPQSSGVQPSPAPTTVPGSSIQPFTQKKEKPSTR